MRSGCQNATVPEEGKIHRTYTIHEIFIESDLKQKTSKNNRLEGTVRSRTQNATVPEEGKIHLTYTIHENFIESDKKKKNQKITDSTVPCVRDAKMRRSRRRAKSTSPIRFMKILLKAIKKKKIKK